MSYILNCLCIYGMLLYDYSKIIGSLNPFNWFMYLYKRFSTTALLNFVHEIIKEVFNVTVMSPLRHKERHTFTMILVDYL